MTPLPTVATSNATPKNITNTVNTVMETQSKLLDTINNQQEIINDLIIAAYNNAKDNLKKKFFS